MLLAVFALAFIALKTCASHEDNVSYQEAEAIARREVDFVPDKVLVRGVQRGLDAQLFWAVSLSTTNAAGIRDGVRDRPRRRGDRRDANRTVLAAPM